MKILILLLLVGVVVFGCPKSDLPVATIACNATQQYAKTINEAAPRLVGSWKLVGVSTGFQQHPAVPNQVIDFGVDGKCIITRDGQSSVPFSYSLSVNSLTGSPTTVLPQLTVNDHAQPALDFLKLGTAHLFICEEELILDYGTAIDGPSSTYRRQSR